MKKILALFLIIVASLCVFSACNAEKADEEGTIPEQSAPLPDDGTTGGEDKSEGTPPENSSTPEDKDEAEKEQITKMYLTVNGNKLEVTLAENTAVEKLVEILKQGDIVYTADDYGGFEKVGSLGHSLPTSNTQITTEPGDVILYSGNQIVLFYGSNSWSYTRLGKISGYSASELAELLCAGKGKTQITISLK